MKNFFSKKKNLDEKKTKLIIIYMFRYIIK